jgi:HAD superfamily hydrolase (TIGR01490 family)
MPGIALFDLDYTLLDFDSDHGWGEFLCDLGKVDAAGYRAKNDQFFADYRAGRLDMQAFIAFSLAPLASLPLDELLALRERFMREQGLAKIRAKGRELVALHQASGDRVAIVTATNDFVTRPFADALGVEPLLATQVLWVDGRPTGRARGTPCFREGKIAHVLAWLNGFGGRLQDCVFYSDSRNDLPLMEAVGRAVAVDPDDMLLAEAGRRGWDVISLKA